MKVIEQFLTGGWYDGM